MTVAIILVVAAVFSLIVILGVTVSRSRSLTKAGPIASIQPIDIEAFRNLTDPEEAAYLQRRLRPSEFRTVQRKRLRAMAAYVQVASRNAALLARLGQSALLVEDAQTADAARQLVDNALRLRRNATLALVNIYAMLFWPTAGPAATRVLSGYERLSGAAMLLGRLQNPAIPVRISSR